MKRKKVDEILIKQAKRRKNILNLLSAIFVIFIISLSLFLLFMHNNKDYYVTYTEDSKIDYKVHIKENDFFEDNYLESNKQYISSLVDYIDADFIYNLSLDEDNLSYKYSYRIESEVNVKQKDTGNSLYSKNTEILKNKEVSTSNKNATIQESVKIDYQNYNELISKFVSTYGLDDIESTLTINMYVNVIGSCENFLDNSLKESVISLTIPLNTKTIKIDTSNDLINSDYNIMQCRKANPIYYIYLVLGILVLILDLGLVFKTIKYIVKTRTAENIYERELKKILNNYSSYIQTLSNDFEFAKYQAVKLETFTDMLEIRDTIRQPILMKENDNKSVTYFVIPTENKIVYIYRLMVKDIKKDMKKAEKTGK